MFTLKDLIDRVECVNRELEYEKSELQLKQSNKQNRKQNFQEELEEYCKKLGEDLGNKYIKINKKDGIKWFHDEVEVGDDWNLMSLIMDSANFVDIKDGVVPRQDTKYINKAFFSKGKDVIMIYLYNFGEPRFNHNWAHAIGSNNGTDEIGHFEGRYRYISMISQGPYWHTQLYVNIEDEQTLENCKRNSREFLKKKGISLICKEEQKDPP